MKGLKYLLVVLGIVLVHQQIKLAREVDYLRSQVGASRESRDRLKMMLVLYTEAVAYHEKGFWLVESRFGDVLNLSCTNPRAHGYTSITVKLSDRNRNKFAGIKEGQTIDLSPIHLLSLGEAERPSMLQLADVVSPGIIAQPKKPREWVPSYRFKGSQLVSREL